MAYFSKIKMFDNFFIQVGPVIFIKYGIII
nr:MAG TPA: hypothetical protein [Caudoviricetes sp.]